MELQALIPQIVDSESIKKILNISDTTLWRYKRQGVIPYIKLGTVHRYQVDKVIQALEVQRQNRKK